MYQIRIHGRGGQGVVTAAEMLSVAAFTEGHWAQAFPSFGSERTGAPVVAFARIDEKEIRLREPIQEPDVVLVQDRTLLESEDVFGGIRPDGYVLINSSSTPEELGLGELIARLPKGHVQTVPATRFAIEGQGVVTAAEMLSVAAFTEGHWAQAFPSFGSERTGAPVVAFARIDEKEIRLREPIQEPDVVLVQDRTLLESEDVFGGIRPDGYVLINSSSTPEELGLGELIARLPKGHVQTVPATRFAIENIGRPLPGAGMLAGFAAMTGAITLENVQAAYNARFGGKIAEANAKVAQAAWDHVKAQLKQAEEN